MPNLNIRISQRSGETKTAQIFNQIASAILAGKFGPGDTITSERALAERLGVSRNIVRNAYRRLEEAGLIETASTSLRRVPATSRRRAPGVAGVSRGDRMAAAGDLRAPAKTGAKQGGAHAVRAGAKKGQRGRRG